MISRREALKGALTAAAALAGGLEQSAAAQTTGRATANAGDLVLTNGKFVDGRGMVASAITVRNGRIAALNATTPVASGTRRIDLGGRTVIPGFVDAHVHYTRAGVNPGYEARRIERAFSIAELQDAIANTLGRSFLTMRGVAVDEATGAVMSPADAVAALQAAQTGEDKLRGTTDLNAHANSLGLTTVVNAGNFDVQELALRLWRERRLTIRMRPLFPADSPQEVEARVRNNFTQGGRALGDDLFRVAGFGERIGGTDTMSAMFEPTARAIAKGGWLLQQHSITLKENDFHLEAFRSIARQHPIDRLRWSIIHLQSIDAPRLKALIDLGAGASAQTWTYMSNAGGPPFRRIVDSGIHAGIGTDSTNVSALDPWLSLFYMTTGRNLAGVLTNDGQQVSRLEALRLYTEGAAWFCFDDDQVGSFVAGKYADLAVLSQDYLTVPEDAIRRIESVLTLVAGAIVHAQPPFTRP
jgi:predicted amidohydrolase YtcJ